MSEATEREQAPEVLRLSGSLTLERATELKRLIVEACEAARDLEVDLSEVVEIDCAGLQLLFALKRAVEAAGATAVFVSPSGATVEVFELAGIDEWLPVARYLSEGYGLF